MAFSIAFTVGGKTFAAPTLDQQLSSSKSQYSDSKQKVSAAQKKANELTASIEALDNQIQQALADINNTNKKISSTEANITEAEANVKRAEESIKIEQDRYNKSIRTMYMNGSSGYLAALLDSKGINDFISKVEIINKVAEYNSQVISNLNQRKTSVNNKKDALNAEKKQLLALKQTKQNTIADLNKKKQQQQPLVDQAKSELNSAVALSSSAQAQVKAINSKLTAMRAQNNTAVAINRGGNASFSGNGLIAYAASFEGTPYVWGGTSPSGFDCSGFVQYVYAHYGVSLPRTSQEQYGVGTPVSQADLQPGDLVFFNGLGHVGMYIGNGYMIHAPHTGDVVKVAPLEGGYVGARRVR